MRIEQIVFSFLDRAYDPSKPILLALSGGGDSLMLFHLLLAYRERTANFNFGIAHIDHGWRMESVQEAELLLKMAEKFHIPFHLKKLDPTQFSSNLEETCRLERLRFFDELCQKHFYQAVLLAHHADDQIETVLKRVLEGYSVAYLVGLRQMSSFQRLNLWRPLLNIKKEDILNWLQEKKLQPFEDVTNRDPRFLRARFRTEIIPTLSASFGKEIKGSLLRLGKESEELDTYMEQQLTPYLDEMRQGSYGYSLDLSQKCPASQFELKYLIKRFCEKNNAYLSHSMIEKACDLIRSGVANRELATGKIKIYIDRKRVFACKQPFPNLDLNYMLELGEGEFLYGGWRVLVETGLEQALEKAQTGWPQAWQGKMQITLPMGKYNLGPAVMSLPYCDKSSTIDTWWTNHKVPAFMRHRIPVVRNDKSIVHEFLSGKEMDNEVKSERWIKISLEGLKLND